jgi:hypothetical protein
VFVSINFPADIFFTEIGKMYFWLNEKINKKVPMHLHFTRILNRDEEDFFQQLRIKSAIAQNVQDSDQFEIQWLNCVAKI